MSSFEKACFLLRHDRWNWYLTIKYVTGRQACLQAQSGAAEGESTWDWTIRSISFQ